MNLGGVAHVLCADSLLKAFAREYRPIAGTPGFPNGYPMCDRFVPDPGELRHVMFGDKTAIPGGDVERRKKTDKRACISEQQRYIHGKS